MKVYRTVWEDVAKRRDVEVHVDYHVNEGAVEIKDIRPVKVTLYHAEDGEVSQVLSVTSETGKNVLARQFRSEYKALEQEILDQHLAV